MVCLRKSSIAALVTLSLSAGAVDMKEIGIEIDKALPIITQCEKTFAEAQKIKVPADYSASQHALKHNEEVSKGSESHKGEKPHTISPEATAFMKSLAEARAEIEKCGIAYSGATTKLNTTLIPQAAAELKSVDPTKSQDPTIAKIVAYSTEQQKMLAALDQLTSNRVMQHRLHHLVTQYFHVEAK